MQEIIFKEETRFDGIIPKLIKKIGGIGYIGGEPASELREKIDMSLMNKEGENNTLDLVIPDFVGLHEEEGTSEGEGGETKDKTEP